MVAREWSTKYNLITHLSLFSMSDTPPALPPASERDWLTFEEVAEKDSEFRAAANAAPKPAPEAEAAALKCLTSEIE